MHSSNQHEKTRLRRVEIMKRLRAGEKVMKITQDLDCDSMTVYVIRQAMKKRET